MKMRILAVAAALICGLFFMGCDSSGGGSSSKKGTRVLKYLDQTTDLTQLFFDKYGDWWTAGVYNIDLTIASDNLNFDEETGTGWWVYLEMFFPTNAVTAGTYTFANTGAAHTFSDSSDITQVVNDEIVGWDDLTGGTVTIAVNGSIYTITGSVTTAEGPATFSYEGPLTEEW